MGIEDWDGCEDWGWALGMGIGDGPWGYGGGVGDMHGASGMGILMGIRDWGWALGMGSGDGVQKLQENTGFPTKEVWEWGEFRGWIGEPPPP